MDGSPGPSQKSKADIPMVLTAMDSDTPESSDDISTPILQAPKSTPTHSVHHSAMAELIDKATDDLVQSTATDLVKNALSLPTKEMEAALSINPKGMLNPTLYLRLRSEYFKKIMSFLVDPLFYAAGNSYLDGVEDGLHIYVQSISGHSQLILSLSKHQVAKYICSSPISMSSFDLGLMVSSHLTDASENDTFIFFKNVDDPLLYLNNASNINSTDHPIELLPTVNLELFSSSTTLDSTYVEFTIVAEQLLFILKLLPLATSVTVNLVTIVGEPGRPLSIQPPLFDGHISFLPLATSTPITQHFRATCAMPYNNSLSWCLETFGSVTTISVGVHAGKLFLIFKTGIPDIGNVSYCSLLSPNQVL